MLLNVFLSELFSFSCSSFVSSARIRNVHLSQLNKANLRFACHCPSNTSTWVDPNVFCNRGFGPQGIDRKLDLGAKESHREPSHAATDITYNPGFYSGSRRWSGVYPRNKFMNVKANNCTKLSRFTVSSTSTVNCTIFSALSVCDMQSSSTKTAKRF